MTLASIVTAGLLAIAIDATARAVVRVMTATVTATLGGLDHAPAHRRGALAATVTGAGRGAAHAHARDLVSEQARAAAGTRTATDACLRRLIMI